MNEDKRGSLTAVDFYGESGKMLGIPARYLGPWANREAMHVLAFEHGETLTPAHIHRGRFVAGDKAPKADGTEPTFPAPGYELEPPACIGFLYLGPPDSYPVEILARLFGTRNISHATATPRQEAEFHAKEPRAVLTVYVARLPGVTSAELDSARIRCIEALRCYAHPLFPGADFALTPEQIIEATCHAAGGILASVSLPAVPPARYNLARAAGQ